MEQYLQHYMWTYGWVQQAILYNNFCSYVRWLTSRSSHSLPVS